MLDVAKSQHITLFVALSLPLVPLSHAFFPTFFSYIKFSHRYMFGECIYENKACAFYYNIKNERQRETEMFVIQRASWGWMKE